MTDAPGARWISCQIGSREHYAVPRALHRRRLLEELVTDRWSGKWPVRMLDARNERFHAELADAAVWSSPLRAAAFEGTLRLAGVGGWEAMVRRNEWFQERALMRLSALAPKLIGKRVVVFAYSYAARRVFEWARRQGWRTILGQIDAGPVEAALVEQLHQRHRDLAAAPAAPPSGYWQQWREEWRLADRVIVNSEWSREALREAGVPDTVLRVVPLAFEGDGAPVARAYPDAFTADRPLRVLFLGQVNLRKGIAEVLDAVRRLQNEPVHFTIAGPVQIRVPADLQDDRSLTWLGRVDKAEAVRQFDAADVFLFPTHSDGFGLTQLEAQARRLPVIASPRCGDVVRDAVNGIRLAQVTGQDVADALRTLVRAPAMLARMATASQVPPRFSLDAVGAALVEAAER